MTNYRTSTDTKTERPNTASTDPASMSPEWTARIEELAAENRDLRDRLSELEGEMSEIKSGSDGGVSTIPDEPAGPSTDPSDETPPVLTSGGMNCKVIGELDDDNGIGVYGANTSGSGTTYGVQGVTDSSADDATGVRGEATAGSGGTFGVYGETISSASDAAGVKGYAADSFGVWGGSNGRNGVEGRASADNWGGVYGEHSTTTGLGIGVIGRNNSPDGAAVWADAVDPNGVAVRAQGRIETTDSILSGGHLEFSDGSPQRTAGPVAKASISSDATIDHAVNVDSVTWNDSVSRYEITLTDIDYFYSEYVTNVTPLSLDYPVARTGSGSDKLFVYFDDGNKHNFHFVVYELPDGTETTSMTVESSGDEGLVGREN